MTHFSPSMKARLLPLQPDNFPDLLKKQKRWLCWKAGPPNADGKFSKVPVDPITGRNINGRNSANWLDFEHAMKAYSSGSADGVGFVLSDQHPIVVDGRNLYVTVADFDHCGSKMTEIQALWLELGRTFIELSPSNNGLHIWGLFPTPLKGGNAGDGRELYSGGRFMTMTGISARGSFKECPGFAAVEDRWFSLRAVQAETSALPPPVDGVGTSGNVAVTMTGDNWWDRLPPDDKDACLAEMLQVAAVIALADLPDGAQSPNWRTVLAACARPGAPNAYNICRRWAQTSKRFLPDDFDARWKSYARG